MNRYTKVRELVKDPSLTIKDIAQQTGYDKGHVNRLRKASQQFECHRCGPEYERGFIDGMQHQMQLHVNRVIKTWHDRCEEHPDHQERIISERMIQARMQEEIDELRQALETDLATVGEVGVWGEWQGLTDEQVEDEWERITQHSIFGGDRSEQRAMYISPDEVFEFSRAIEAKLKDKNNG